LLRSRSVPGRFARGPPILRAPSPDVSARYWAARRDFDIVATPDAAAIETTTMTFKSLLDAWAAEQKPARTSETYAVHLAIEDAAKVHALADLFPGVTHERVITDLLSAALERIEAAIPYEAGEKVIREDEFGDPVYEDKGLTPQFLDLVKKYRRQLED
jgi:hypothetical protein